MKKCFSVFLLLLFVMTTGCSNSESMDSSHSIISSISNDSSSQIETSSDVTFSPYEIQVKNSSLSVYEGPSYNYSVIGTITDNGTYKIIEESKEISENAVTTWGKLESEIGWINLDDAINGDNEDLENNSSEIATGTYILPESSTRLLTDRDLEGLDSTQLMLARNEIFARHGRIFNDSTIRAYFESQPWYQGTVLPEDFLESCLSEVEKANIETIMSHENSGLVEGSLPDNNSQLESTYRAESSQPELESESKTDIEESNILPESTSEQEFPSSISDVVPSDRVQVQDDVYGAGQAQSQEINGLIFSWYDRYEQWTILGLEKSIDIISLEIREEVDVYGDDVWRAYFEVEVSDGDSAVLSWNAYDSEGYFLDTVPIRTFSFQGKYRGEGYVGSTDLDYGKFKNSTMILIPMFVYT